MLCPRPDSGRRAAAEEQSLSGIAHDYMLLIETDAAESFRARLMGPAVTFKGFNQPSCTAADELKTRGWLAGWRARAPERPFV